MQHSVSEIGWANLFITKERSKIIDYTDWYLQEPSCFLYRKSDPYTGIYLLVFPLEVQTWLAILALLPAVNLFFMFYSLLIGQSEVALDTLVIYQAAVTFMNSHNFTHSLPSHGIRY